MIAVDTSVWIDVLNGNDSPAAQRCVELIEDSAPVAITDVVFTEVLQGLRSAREAQQVAKHFAAFPVLRLETIDDLALAAELTARAAEPASPSERRSTA